MWIQSDREQLQSLHPDDIDAGEVTFSENDLAQCSREDGELLIDRYDFIHEHDP